MTGPSSNPRPRVDQLTDDTLDQLYARAEQAEAELAVSREVARRNRGHVRTIVPELERAEAAIARVRAECDRIEAAVNDNPTSPDLAGGYLACLRHIRAALDSTT